MAREIDYPYYSTASTLPAAGTSWGAIFAGAFVVIATMAMLTMLGTGIGLAAAPAAADAGSAGAKGLGIGAGVWLLISAIASFYAGGWVTGRLNRTGIVSDGVVHSLVTWAFAATAFMFLVTSAIGGAIGGAAGMVGTAVGGATQAGAQAAQQQPGMVDRVTDQARAQADQLRDRLQGDPQARQQAVQTAETASKAAGLTGIGGFFLMLIEALACAAGGRSGTRVFRPRPINVAPRQRETALT